MCPGLEDEFTTNLINQKACDVPGDFSIDKSDAFIKSRSVSMVAMSSYELFTGNGKNPTPGCPERTWWVANRDFDEKFDPSTHRPAQQAAADPRILISLGTELCFNYELIDALIAYFGSTQWDTIFTFGGNKLSYAKYKDIFIANKNFKLELVINQRQVLASGRDVFVTHCGAGSTYESMYFGVPILGVPQNFDQPLHAKAIADLDCGIVLDDSPETDIFGKIGERMKTLLGNFEFYRGKVLEQQQRFMDGDNNEVVIDKVMKSFEKDPEAFKIRWQENTANSLKPVFVPRKGKGTPLSQVGVVLFLILSFVIYWFWRFFFR